MNFKKRTQELSSLTKGTQALALFRDRHDLIEIFLKYLNDSEPHDKIIIFQGEGGQGKSLLLTYLQKHCCKWLFRQDWDRIKNLSPQKLCEEIVKFNQPIIAEKSGILAQLYQKIIQPIQEILLGKTKQTEPGEQTLYIPALVATLDFDAKPTGGERPQDPFDGLMILRRQLTGYDLSFPRYSFGCIMYLKKTGQLKLENLKKVLPSEEFSLAASLVNLFINFSSALQNSLFGTIPLLLTLSVQISSFIFKYWGLQWTIQDLKKQLTQDEIEAIENLDPHTQLLDVLPELLAHDLNATMQVDEEKIEQFKRVVIFLDTHEAFWGQQRNLSDALYFQQDEWLRRFLKYLDLSLGIVVVVTGREIPRWNEAAKYKISQDQFDIYSLQYLTNRDAHSYLEEALQTFEISDELKQAIVNCASVESDRVYPFYLGLCADVVLENQEINPERLKTLPEIADKSKELIDLLLKYVDEEIQDAVAALCACREFDENLYLKLGKELHFYATAASFRRLTRFSFVQITQANRYQIHQLIRRLQEEKLSSEVSQEINQRAHQILEEYYRQQENKIEAIYHANHLNSQASIEEWLLLFEAELRASNYEQCRALLELSKVITIPTAFLRGKIAKNKGEYYVSLAKYREAEDAYSQAIEAYNTAIEQTSEPDEAYSSKGVALLRLGELFAKLSRYPEANTSYQEALKVYAKLISLNRDSAKAYINQSIIFSRLGELEAQERHQQEALENYQQAITVCEQSLKLQPNFAQAYHQQGLVLANLGELQVQLSQSQEALQNYERAIAAYQQAIAVKPDYVNAYNNQGIALQNLGQLQAQLSQESLAAQSYQQAIQAYDRALTLAPHLTPILNNKALALSKIGDLQAQQTHSPEAFQYYSEALKICQQTLKLTPDFIDVYDTQGTILQSLAELQKNQSNYQDAVGTLKSAIASYNQALQLAPNLIQTHKNKGFALKKLGELQKNQRSQRREAYQHLQAALDEFSLVLQMTPDDADIQQWQVQIQEYLSSF